MMLLVFNQQGLISNIIEFSSKIHSLPSLSQSKFVGARDSAMDVQAGQEMQEALARQEREWSSW